MWCAYLFAVIAFISLSQAINSHNAVTLVSWVSQTFLQLVLLSVIIVGQNVLAAAADKRSEATRLFFQPCSVFFSIALDDARRLDAFRAT